MLAYGTMSTFRRELGPGPFRAEQVPEKSPYELSNGHAILCLPTGARGARANLVGGAVLDSDPAVESAGVDVGFSQAPGDLRAPHVAVGNVPDAPGWVTGVPALAVEYVDRGQDEAALEQKVGEFLAGGTKFVWVVHLTGPRRVDVHEPGREPRVVGADGVLAAPGILKNEVPVRALYERDAAHQATLRNLLQRAGYAGLDQVRQEGVEQGREEGVEQGREEGVEQGRAEGLRQAVEKALRRGGRQPTDVEVQRLRSTKDADELGRWLDVLLS